MIPKIIHRVWLGPARMPDDYVAYGESWKRLHPGWDVRTWTEADLPRLQNADIYDLVPSWSSKSDVVRFELMTQFGGIYADCDVEPLKPLDPLAERFDGFVGWEIEGHALGTAVIGCAQGHPYFQAVVDQLPSAVRDFPLDRPALTTGPGHLTRVYFRERARLALAPRFAVLPAACFFPYLWHEGHRRHETFPHAYAAHHWGGSWLEPPV